jgi:hypothetical protein
MPTNDVAALDCELRHSATVSLVHSGRIRSPPPLATWSGSRAPQAEEGSPLP